MSFELRVEGKVLEGFEAGSLVLTMDEPANTFEVEYVADSRELAVRSIFAGDACELALEGDTVLSGYVDATEDDDDAEAIRLRAVGRSKAGDLVDCAAVAVPGRWSKATILTIATDICFPFGVRVTVEGSAGDPFPEFSLQKGESAYDAIARAALKRGLQVYSVGGDLVLARAGTTRTSTVLTRGEKPLVRSVRSDSWYGRHSEYIYRAQTRATDTSYGKSAAHLKHSVLDRGITRYRPLYVQAEAQDGVSLQTRATVERNQRNGRGERLSAVVDGWTTEEGSVWRPNTLVAFDNPVLGVNATLLIAVVHFRFGARQPRETELELARPEAYDLADYPALGRGDSWT